MILPCSIDAPFDVDEVVVFYVLVVDVVCIDRDVVGHQWCENYSSKYEWFGLSNHAKRFLGRQCENSRCVFGFASRGKCVVRLELLG